MELHMILMFLTSTTKPVYFINVCLGNDVLCLQVIHDYPFNVALCAMILGLLHPVHAWQP